MKIREIQFVAIGDSGVHPTWTSSAKNFERLESLAVMELNRLGRYGVIVHVLRLNTATPEGSTANVFMTSGVISGCVELTKNYQVESFEFNLISCGEGSGYQAVLQLEYRGLKRLAHITPDAFDAEAPRLSKYLTAIVVEMERVIYGELQTDTVVKIL